MECDQIVVASLIGNVNSCKEVFNINSPETVPQDSDDGFNDSGRSKVQSTSLKNSNELCKPKPNRKSRQIGRFKFTRSASSPIMVVRSPPKYNSSSNDVIKEDSGTANGTNCEWKLKSRHVSFDECVHVLTKSSVIEMPLKNSTLETNMVNCCTCRKGILKQGEGNEMVKAVSFELDELLCTTILNHDLSEFEHVCQQWEVNFNRKLSNGLALLHLACIEGCFRIAQFILKHGGRVDELDELGWTPLHYAALHGHVPCAVVLLQAGADVNTRTADYCTAIELASQDEIMLLLARVINGASSVNTSLDENKETYV